ncbi:MAG: hypothetical protein ACYSW8_11135 [Planctomycetota bacterium]|jgi:hypothetical protein
MIEIIQVKKFDEPFRATSGDTVKVSHQIGETLLNFQCNIHSQGIILYSVLVRREGELSVMLVSSDELIEFSRKDYMCADPVLWDALQELAAPKVLEIKDEG